MVTELKQQRRGRKIAMSDAERDEFLRASRVCRVATVGPSGPHATPLWYVWDGAALWLYSLTRSQRWADLMNDPRIGVVVDGGEQYLELHGVELTGTVTPVGEQPRAGEQNAELTEPERLFSSKYGDGQMHYDGAHAWLKVTPAKIVSWDFRKLAP